MLTGEQIRQARHLAGIRTQQELADLLGVSYATIQRAEAAGAALPQMRIDAMARLFDALEERGVRFMMAGERVRDGWRIIR